MRRESDLDGAARGTAGRWRTLRRPRPFGLLWGAGTISALGDGVHWIALPLLAASVTSDPRLVSLVSVAEQLPWVLFGLLAGALADRVDRRRVLWRLDLVRAGIVAVLAGTVLTDSVTLPVVLLVAFTLTTVGTVYDAASAAMVPALVPVAERPAANGRLQAGTLVADTLLGAPVGATLFTLYAAAPFLVDTASFAVAAALVAAIPVAAAPHTLRTAAPTRSDRTAAPAGTGGTLAAPAHDAAVPVRDEAAVPVRGEAAAPSVRGVGAASPVHAGRTRTSLRSDIGAGLRFLLAHRLLRRLCWYGALINLVTTVAVALLVLYTRDVLHLDSLGYGLLVAAFAVGGVLGSLLAGRLARAIGGRPALLTALVLGALGAAGIALAPHPVPAAVAVGVFGAANGLWGVVAVSLRQSLVPDALFGRVTSAFRLVTLGVGPLGALAAGFVAHRYGLRAPIVVAAALLVAGTLVAPLLLRRTDLPVATG
ncbi:MFS transporter [Actinocatenispora sera]|uniref:MFS transporter n=1 Tax=Actinocatenispora sera TaxID=390989 RepID=UPI000A77391A|nr:MFS transporter [Actinocatenispora sera]